MFDHDVIFGWILDSLAKRFGPGRVSGWIVLACVIFLAIAGIGQLILWAKQ